MAKSSETENVVVFTPSVAKHYGNSAASLARKAAKLSEELTEHGCESGKVRQLLERLIACTAPLEEAILGAAEGGRINPLEQLQAERERAEKRAASARKARAARQAKAEENAAEA